MAADRFETPNQNTAGTNPSEVAPHLSEVPYDNTSLQEAIDNADLRDNIDTGQLQEVQTGTYWSDRPPAREVTALLDDQQPALPDHAPVAEAATASTYQPVESLPNAPEKKSKKRPAMIVGALGALAATGAAAAALFMGPKGGDNAGATAPETSRPVATAPAVPGETAKPTDGEAEPFTVDSLKIPAGLSDQQFGQTFINHYVRWIHNGATTESQKKWLDNPNDAILSQIASDNTFTAAEALYGPDWQKNPILVKEVKVPEQSNEDYLRMRFMTDGNPNGGDPVAYSENMTVDTVERVSANPDGGRTLHITGHIWNNSDKNSMGATFPEVKKNNGKAYSTTVTTKIVNGTEYIVNYPDLVQ